MPKKKISFNKWIDEQGIGHLARTLDVSKPAVHHWKMGSAAPRPHHMKHILKLSKGVITYDAMINHYLTNNK